MITMVKQMISKLAKFLDLSLELYFKLFLKYSSALSAPLRVGAILFSLTLTFAHSPTVYAENSNIKPSSEKSFYDIELQDINGKKFPLAQYRGKVLMIVNTASECGFTPQFKDLVDLQKEFGPMGFQILAFPSNDFHQDKGSAKESEEFAKKNYQINFPILNKGHVGGKETHELYLYLNKHAPGIPNIVMWNFEKILVDKNGKVVERYRSMTKPSAPAVRTLIEKLLKDSKP